MNPIDLLRITKRTFEHMRAEFLDENVAARNVIIRSDDVWLVSYPKSGNTWTRFLLASLVYKESKVGFNNIENLVPDIYQHSNHTIQSQHSTRYLKSHEYFDPRYKRVILIVRDPRDVAVSYYHHRIKFRPQDKNLSLDDFIEQFINGDIDNFGTWGENVGSWLGAKHGDKNMLLLRYEDMLEDTGLALRKIASFLELEVNSTEIEKIIKHCSLNSMKALEKEQGDSWKALKGTDNNKLFVRRGKAREWKEALTNDQANKIFNCWKKQIEALGYY